MGENLQKRIITFFVILGIGILFLGPTLDRTYFGKNWISRPISLGLDLSGGVYIVYEVQRKEAVKSRMQGTANSLRVDLRKDKIAVTKVGVNEKNQIEVTLLTESLVEKAKAKIEETYRDLSFIEKKVEESRAKVVYGISESLAQKIEENAINQAVETLRERVDQFGVSEALVQKVGANRILLQMPGFSDVESVKKIVGSVAKLEFRLVPPASALPTTSGVEGQVTLKAREGGTVKVEEQTLMTGDAVDKATVGTEDGQVMVLLSLTSEGGKTFRKITAENVGRQLAIILDGVVYSSPEIKMEIGGGSASISGGFTYEEAHQLAVVLRAGALPAPLKVLEERTVGPTLGKESIKKGVVAIIAGFILVILFMVVYYRKAGVVAVGSLALNLLFVLALLSAFGATLTLPGLAGLALTIGMAVDSNVIIFERIRDELRNGATRDAAVHAGFDKALSAIIDSNLTTLLSAVILYYFGTGPVRGFAVTLSIGIITTVYCATFVSKLAFDYFPLRNEKGLSI